MTEDLCFLDPNSLFYEPDPVRRWERFIAVSIRRVREKRIRDLLHLGANFEGGK